MNKLLRAIGSLIFIVAATLLLTEAAYRFYLHGQLQQEVLRRLPPPDLSRASAYGVAPWRFDRQQGFVFQERPWLYAQVTNGVFQSCDMDTRGSRYGKLGDNPDAYDKADVRLIVLGSSFSLVKNAKDQYVTAALSERLSRRSNRNVEVLNFSRDATGIVTSFDIAGAVAETLKPDAFIVLMNVTAFAYHRHWRRVIWDDSGLGRLYFIHNPNHIEKPELAGPPHSQVLNRQVTAEWCRKMSEAKAKGDFETLKNDPLVGTIVQQHIQLQKERTIPKIAVDFTRLDISFIYKFIVHKDPFYKVQLFKQGAANNGFTLNKFTDDKQFQQNLERVKSLKIPILLVHIPSIQDIRNANGGFDFLSHGVSPDLGKSLQKNLEDVTDGPFIHLYESYPPELRKTPLKLVMSDTDSHPSPLGVDVMADALERLLVEHPKTRELFLKPRSSH